MKNVCLFILTIACSILLLPAQRNAKQEGYTVTYSYKKLRSAEGVIQNGAKSGRWIYRNIKGITILEENYLDGTLHGEYAKYFDEAIITVFNAKLYRSHYLKYQDADSTGYIMERGTYDHGRKNGIFEYYNYRGYMYRSATYRNDTLDGPLNEFYASGVPLRSSTFRNGDLHGPYTEYDQQGKPEEAGQYFNGKKRGLWISREGGSIYEVTYRDDVADGPCTTYSAARKPVNISQYRNGIPDGPYTIYNYDRDGLLQTIVKGKYVDGFRQGEVSLYTADNVLMATFNEENGMKQGPYTSYYRDGSIRETGFYKNNSQHNTCTEYDENGKVSRILLYNEGDLEKSTVFWPGGKIRQAEYEGSEYQKQILKEYTENGSLRYIKTETPDSVIFISYHPNGKRSAELHAGAEMPRIWYYNVNGKEIGKEAFLAKYKLPQEMEELTEVSMFPPPPPEPVAAPEEILTMPEESPEFPGGQKALFEFLLREIKYPSMAMEMGIQGSVYVRFVIEKDGTVTDPRIVKGLGSGCDEEVLRVIKRMPPWEPGKVNGNPVRVTMQIPVKFALR